MGQRSRPEQPRWRVRLATVQDIDALADCSCRLASETEGEELNPAMVRAHILEILEDPHT